MILCIKTDNPTAELYLYKGGNEIAKTIWEANRTLARDLLKCCDELLMGKNISWQDLSGIVVYKGPGSFTGLRIGITTANTVTYSQTIPVVGETGENWRQIGINRLQNGQNDNIVLPEYGAEAHITAPRK